VTFGYHASKVSLVDMALLGALQRNRIKKRHTETPSHKSQSDVENDRLHMMWSDLSPWDTAVSVLVGHCDIRTEMHSSECIPTVQCLDLCCPAIGHRVTSGSHPGATQGLVFLFITSKGPFPTGEETIHSQTTYCIPQSRCELATFPTL
jgi:hypothetical protein